MAMYRREAYPLVEEERPNLARQTLTSLLLGIIIVFLLLGFTGRLPATGLPIKGFGHGATPFSKNLKPNPKKSVKTAPPVVIPGLQNAILQYAKKYAYHDAYPRFASNGCKPVYIPNVANNLKPAIAQTISEECATQAYKQAWNGAGWGKIDCAAFVATVLWRTGIDRNYPSTWTPGQVNYIRAHPNKYQIVSRSKLQPGDILIFGNAKKGIGHTEIYAGPGLGNGYFVIDASGEYKGNNKKFNHVPMYNGIWDLNYIFANGGFGVHVLN